MTDIVQTVKGLVNEVRALKAVGDTQAVVDLQATLDAANADLNAAIDDANSRIDTLGDTTLPGLTSQLQQAQSDITAAQSTLSDHDKALETAKAQLAGESPSKLGTDVQTALDSRQAVLKLVSDRGTTFKNSALSTAIRVTIFYGQTTITNSSELASTFGATAYLEWRWRRIGDADWKTILSTDSHISDGGFTFTVSPDDVDAQTVFSATLNI